MFIFNLPHLKWICLNFVSVLFMSSFDIACFLLLRLEKSVSFEEAAFLSSDKSTFLLSENQNTFDSQMFQKKNPASLLTNFTVFKAAQKIKKNTPWIPLNVTTRCCCIQALHIFAVSLYISLETSSLDPCLLLRISFGVWPAACDSYVPDIKPQ